jgi:hypothetical protein
MSDKELDDAIPDPPPPPPRDPWKVSFPHDPSAFRKLPKGYRIDGDYMRRDRPGVLRIVKGERREWRVYIDSDSPVRDLGTSPPCSVVAEGIVKGGWLIAPVVPYSYKDYSFDGEGTETGNILYIEFARGRAIVWDGASDGICAMHADMSGTYFLATDPRPD